MNKPQTPEKKRIQLAKKFMSLKKRGAKAAFLVESGVPQATMYSWVKKYT